MVFLTLGGFLQASEIVLRNRKTDVPMSFEVHVGALSLPSWLLIIDGLRTGRSTIGP
jgi:hypothetical protein